MVNLLAEVIHSAGDYFKFCKSIRHLLMSRFIICLATYETESRSKREADGALLVHWDLVQVEKFSERRSSIITDFAGCMLR